MKMKYNRILLKLSGESFQGDDGYSIDYQKVRHFANEVKTAVDRKVQVGIVIGGGNIFRGMKGAGRGFDRRQGDYMGMLATVINSMALQTVLEEIGVAAKVMSALKIEGICEKIFFKNAIAHLEAGNVVIFSAGTGNPFFTTDSGAALRAVEIGADLLLKGTRVDGIYTADPEKDPNASKYDEISFDDCYEKKLNIMDLTAFTICKENNMPICVYNANIPGNLAKILDEQKVGTLVH